MRYFNLLLNPLVIQIMVFIQMYTDIFVTILKSTSLLTYSSKNDANPSFNHTSDHHNGVTTLPNH